MRSDADGDSEQKPGVAPPRPSSNNDGYIISAKDMQAPANKCNC